MKLELWAIAGPSPSTSTSLRPLIPRPQRYPQAISGSGALHEAVHGHGADHKKHHQGEVDKETPFGLQPWQYAFLLATASGLSMPVGAVLGMLMKPRDEVIAKWIAFGAGALLFAVSVELYGHSIHSYHHGVFSSEAMVILMVVSLFGSWFFTWIARKIEGEEEDEGEKDAAAEDDEDVEIMQKCLRCGQYNTPGALFCNWCGNDPTKMKQTQMERAMYGTVPSTTKEVVRSARFEAPRSPITSDRATTAQKVQAYLKEVRLTPHEKAGMRRQTARSVGAMMREMQFQEKVKARARWAQLREAIKQLGIIKFLKHEADASRKLESDGACDSARSSGSLPEGSMRDPKRKAWFLAFKDAFSKKRGEVGITPKELSEMQLKNRSAAMTMLTMLLVDGIPEGILMGFMAAAGNLGVTFVLSLLVANFPEAYAGGVMMLNGGFSRPAIVGMWGGLTLLTGSLSGAACYLLLWANPSYTGGHDVPFSIQVLVCVMEGMAGGAMVSGIAACMLPEAFERRDHNASITQSSGFLCLAGFLLAVSMKLALDG